MLQGMGCGIVRDEVVVAFVALGMDGMLFAVAGFMCSKCLGICFGRPHGDVNGDTIPKKDLKS